MPTKYLLLFVAVAFMTLSVQGESAFALGRKRSKPEPSGPWLRRFLIHKGQHDSGTHYQFGMGDTLSFTGRFDQSAKYATSTPSNQWDINKLMGFSDCGDAHHKNSARFGWRWVNGELEIHAYVYVNSVRKSEYIQSVRLDQNYNYQISVDRDHYVFQIGSKTVRMPRGCSSGRHMKYRLYPYFGGDETAPHDISIWANIE